VTTIPSIKFKCRGLRNRLTELVLAKYRDLAEDDWTRAEPRRNIF
jgi:hypothetical protein